MGTSDLNAYLQPNDAPVAQGKGEGVASFDFSQNYARNSVTPSKIPYLPANKITAGTVLVGINVGTTGGGYVLIDGANNRIVVNDGTVNRIIIGNLP